MKMAIIPAITPGRVISGKYFVSDARVRLAVKAIFDNPENTQHAHHRRRIKDIGQPISSPKKLPNGAAITSAIKPRRRSPTAPSAPYAAVPDAGQRRRHRPEPAQRQPQTGTTIKSKLNELAKETSKQESVSKRQTK